MSRWGTVRLKRAQIGREQSKSCTATEYDPIFCLGLFFGRRGRANHRQPAPAILYLWKTHQRVECFELNRSKPVFYQPRKTIRRVSDLGNSEDKSDANIVSLPDSESGQHWTRILHTCRSKCQCFQSTGILNEVSPRIFLAQRLCHVVIKVLPQHSYNSNVQVHNCSALLLERYSNFLAKAKVCLLHLIVVPWSLLDCNFIPLIRLLRFQIFHSTNFTNGAHVMWFPTCCCFCLIDFRLPCKIKIQ